MVGIPKSTKDDQIGIGLTNALSDTYYLLMINFQSQMSRLTAEIVQAQPQVNSMFIGHQLRSSLISMSIFTGVDLRSSHAAQQFRSRFFQRDWWLDNAY